MSVYLTEQDKQALLDARGRGEAIVERFWAALQRRTAQRAQTPGLLGEDDDATWWYPAAEYVSDAAMAFALEPSESLGAWLGEVSLWIARQPESDWIGPWFRDHDIKPPVGHLETAHLCWALAAAIDLAPEVFKDGERDEIHAALTDKGIPLCRAWLDRNTHLANWRGVMTAGLAAAAAVTGDDKSLKYATEQTHVVAEAFQPDGCYAESLQYSNYLALSLMMAYESITGATPALQPAGPEVLAKLMPWYAQSHLYMRPMAGWGDEPRARAVNFNDSAAIFRPSGDLLMQIAARCRDTMPTEAGLARWLFDTCYAPVPDQTPHNLATFGLRNDWGFQTLRWLAQSAPAVSPEQAKLPPVQRYSNGNVLVRDGWPARTVLAIQGGTDPLHGPGHLHGDLNSFTLTHRDQRLLVDPGHSCYRNLIHGLESSTQTHNTCTFLLKADALGLQEDLAKSTLLEQSNIVGRRPIDGLRVGDPVAPRGRHLLTQRLGEVTVTVSEVGALYGEPIQQFTRLWVSIGVNALFVVDRIEASAPVRTVWNWLLNHRDGQSTFDVHDGALTMRRGGAGLRLVHGADGQLNGPVYAMVHDAYHPEPDRPGEGHAGSGMLYRWIEPEARTARVTIHAIAVDEADRIDRWTVDRFAGACSLMCDQQQWTLTVPRQSPLELSLTGPGVDPPCRIVEQSDAFELLHDKGTAS